MAATQLTNTAHKHSPRGKKAGCCCWSRPYAERLRSEALQQSERSAGRVYTDGPKRLHLGLGHGSELKLANLATLMSTIGPHQGLLAGTVSNPPMYVHSEGRQWIRTNPYTVETRMNYWQNTALSVGPDGSIRLVWRKTRVFCVTGRFWMVGVKCGYSLTDGKQIHQHRSKKEKKSYWKLQWPKQFTVISSLATSRLLDISRNKLLEILR